MERIYTENLCKFGLWYKLFISPHTYITKYLKFRHEKISIAVFFRSHKFKIK